MLLLNNVSNHAYSSMTETTLYTYVYFITNLQSSGYVNLPFKARSVSILDGPLGELKYGTVANSSGVLTFDSSGGINLSADGDVALFSSPISDVANIIKVAIVPAVDITTTSTGVIANLVSLDETGSFDLVPTYNEIPASTVTNYTFADITSRMLINIAENYIDSPLETPSDITSLWDVFFTVGFGEDINGGINPLNEVVESISAPAVYELCLGYYLKFNTSVTQAADIYSADMLVVLDVALGLEPLYTTDYPTY